jgi:hypothetical protein
MVGQGKDPGGQDRLERQKALAAIACASIFFVVTLCRI